MCPPKVPCHPRWRLYRAWCGEDKGRGRGDGKEGEGGEGEQSQRIQDVVPTPAVIPKGPGYFSWTRWAVGSGSAFPCPNPTLKFIHPQNRGWCCWRGGAEQLPKTPNPGKRGLKIPKNPTVPNFPSVPGKSHFPGRAGASPGVFRTIKGSAGMILMIPMGCDQ